MNKYRVTAIITTQTEVIYDILADSEEDAKNEILDGGYIPVWEEEPIDKDFQIENVELISAN